MHGFATVLFGEQRISFVMSPLSIAEAAANHYGFYDVDLKDNDRGSYCLVASAPNRTVTARGKTLDEAVSKMLDIFGRQE
jgi:hypothetical protein